MVPAGECTWNNTLTINKGIILKGAGIDNTVIIINGPGGHGYFDGQIVPEPDPEQPQPTEIITLQDMLNSYGQYQRGEVSIDFFLERFLKWVVYK